MNKSENDTTALILDCLSIYENEFDYQLVKEDEQKYYIIINSDIIKTDIIYYVLLNVKKTLEENNMSIMIGVGGICENLSDLYTSFVEAYISIRQGTFSHNEDIYFYKNEIDIHNPIYFPMDLDSNILNCLYDRNIDGVNSLITNILENNEHLTNMYVHNLASIFINMYMRIANKLKFVYDINEINNTIKNVYNRELLTDILQKLFSELMVFNHTRDDTASKVYSFIVNYIDQNYADPNISIDFLADQLNLSVAYVSTMFKKAMGIVFSQYLSDYRINKALELLKNTDIKVKEISDQVGFGTYNNFARAFRKKIGVSPNDYRNSTN